MASAKESPFINLLSKKPIRMLQVVSTWQGYIGYSGETGAGDALFPRLLGRWVGILDRFDITDDGSVKRVSMKSSCRRIYLRLITRHNGHIDGCLGKFKSYRTLASPDGRVRLKKLNICKPRTIRSTHDPIYLIVHELELRLTCQPH